jgi:hypothetical protein
VVPVTNRQASKLIHHRSVVNTALFHPSLPLLYTCGVEKMVKEWSTTAAQEAEPAIRREPRPVKPRLSYQTILTQSALTEEELLREDPEMLSTFDYLLEYDQARADLFQPDSELAHVRG